MAVAYEFKNVQDIKDVHYQVIGSQVHERIDTESLVATNTALTDPIKGNIQRNHDEVWGDAIDNAEAFYQKQRSDYYGLSYLAKIRGVVEFMMRPHSVEVSFPLPGLAGLRRRLSADT